MRSSLDGGPDERRHGLDKAEVLVVKQRLDAADFAHAELVDYLDHSDGRCLGVRVRGVPEDWHAQHRRRGVAGGLVHLAVEPLVRVTVLHIDGSLSQHTGADEALPLVHVDFLARQSLSNLSHQPVGHCIQQPHRAAVGLAGVCEQLGEVHQCRGHRGRVRQHPARPQQGVHSRVLLENAGVREQRRVGRRQNVCHAHHELNDGRLEAVLVLVGPHKLHDANDLAAQVHHAVCNQSPAVAVDGPVLGVVLHVVVAQGLLHLGDGVCDSRASSEHFAHPDLCQVRLVCTHKLELLSGDVEHSPPVRVADGAERVHEQVGQGVQVLVRDDAVEGVQQCLFKMDVVLRGGARVGAFVPDVAVHRNIYASDRWLHGCGASALWPRGAALRP
mmetsp:Transcript_22967/g.53627  ORF Transcript_22967/g.53627 Transcript_22967/m.53627 type:complete len:387 (+) Transcript_22967:1995-3155(+)